MRKDLDGILKFFDTLTVNAAHGDLNEPNRRERVPQESGLMQCMEEERPLQIARSFDGHCAKTVPHPSPISVVSDFNICFC